MHLPYTYLSYVHTLVLGVASCQQDRPSLSLAYLTPIGIWNLHRCPHLSLLYHHRYSQVLQPVAHLAAPGAGQPGGTALRATRRLPRTEAHLAQEQRGHHRGKRTRDQRYGRRPHLPPGGTAAHGQLQLQCGEHSRQTHLGFSRAHRLWSVWLAAIAGWKWI